jgi:hypothetical protein
MGVVVTLDVGDDPQGDATATVEYRVSGDGAYRQGFPISRVSDTRFAGSLFWLEPGTTYDVRVTFSDPSSPLDGVTVSGTASTRAEIAVPNPTPSTSLYVSPNGSGTACSDAVPCSLSEGISQAQPGDQVLLRGGIYYQGEISLPRSGSPGGRIVVRSEPGEVAVLDGGDPATFTWTAQGGGVYHTTVNTPDPHLVMAGGQRLLPYQSLSDLQNLVWSTPGFYASDTDLYVRLAGDADPNGATMVVSRFNHAFYVAQDYIYFVDLTFRHYGQGSYAKAIYFNNASDNLVQGCTFTINDLGVGLKRDSHRNVIQDNEFYDTLFDWPWDAFYAGISLSSGGIRFYSPTAGRGTIIRRNTFHDYFDGFGACPDSTGGETNETDIYENLVYRAGDDGMETDGTCSNVRIWGNTFRDVLMGISLAPVYDGPVYAIRNVIYRTGVGNNSYTGSPFKFNSGYDPSGPMVLLHNTADAVLPGNNGLYVKAPGTWDLIYARNNVWAGTDYALNNYNTGNPIDLDYDDLWNAGANDLIRWDGTRYSTLADFAAATGQEQHGLNVEPDFTDALAGDYTLAPSSDLIDAGLVIPGINDDYAGAAPDIGAYEYEADYGFTLSVDPPSQGIAPGGVATYTVAVVPVGGFTETVALVTASPSPSLTVSLAPASLELPGQATLRVTDTHTGPSLLPGLYHTIPVTGTGGGVTQTVHAGLLVGGTRLYLPLVLRDAGSLAVWGGAVQLAPLVESQTGFEVTADSCSAADIQAAADLVKTAGGGTVYIPAGTCEHSSDPIRLPDGINLTGAGQDKTFISNGNIRVNTRHYGKLNKPFRISGIYLGGDSKLQIDTARDFRVDHCTFESTSGAAITVSGSVSGVIDHCTVKVTGSYYGVVVSGGYDAVWEEDIRNLLGQPTAIFVEDCTFEGTHHAVVGHGAAHYVFRYNVTRTGNAHQVDAHGPGYGPPYGTRAAEIYGNILGEQPGGWKAIALRGGGGVIFDNTIRDFRNGTFLVLESGSECPPNDGCECYPLAGQVHDVWIWNNVYEAVAEDQVRVTSLGGTALDPQCYIQQDRDYFLRAPSQAEDGFTYVPYPYPHPFTKELTLRGFGMDRAIHLGWDVIGGLPSTSTWQIDYDGPVGDEPPPITGVVSPTRAYTLTGLTNYEWYTVTLQAMVDSSPILTDSVRARPTDIHVYLPLVFKGG